MDGADAVGRIRRLKAGGVRPTEVAPNMPANLAWGPEGVKTANFSLPSAPCRSQLQGISPERRRASNGSRSGLCDWRRRSVHAMPPFSLAMPKRGLLLFWAAWLSIVVTTNLFDALLALDVLD